jgi:glyoxylase-like metal-dependent hydrolase (beta-lactamase superfamily II)
MSATEVRWDTPGIFPVAPDVYRIPLPLPNDSLRAVNVYAIVDGGGVVVVDAGWVLDEGRELMATSLATLGFGLGDISEFLVTHVHADHYSQAVAIRRDFGTRVSLGAGERPTLELLARPATERGLFPPLRLLHAAGADELFNRLRPIFEERGDLVADWGMPDRWLASEDIQLSTRTLRVIATPGHTQGHVVFLDAAAGLLFAGDHVLPHITPSIGFEAATGPRPLQDYLFSLQLMRAMPDSMLLPAHGPTREHVHDRVDELIEHHRARLAHCRDAIAAGSATAVEVAEQLRWTRRERTLAELDPFNQMLAVLESVAHLEVLVERGALTSSTESGVTVYSS